MIVQRKAFTLESIEEPLKEKNSSKKTEDKFSSTKSSSNHSQEVRTWVDLCI